MNNQVYVVSSWKVVDGHARFIRVIGVYTNFDQAVAIIESIKSMSTSDKVYYGGMTVLELNAPSPDFR
jgi:hypothetical protein